MKKSIYIISSLLIAIILFSAGCKKDKSEKESQVPSEIDKFIWYGLNTYYLWVDDVEKLSPASFNNDTNQLNAFLCTYTDHEKLFYDLLYKYEEIDKWSWIVDDYEALENFFQGITKSMGYDFRLVRIGSSDNIFGFVRYVVKGSPADLAGMKRGDIFMKVNDQQLTVSNYEDLLINSESYKLSFANIVSNTIVLNGQSVNLTAVVIEENPVYFDTVYNINSYKVGYLVYNSFTPTFDIQMNDVFSKFKAAGVNKLILDLRYNGGGSIGSAIYLASMIYGTDTKKIFVKMKFNDLLQYELTQEMGSDYFNNYFANVIDATDETEETPINSLYLSDVYIITTDNTASASELVINGLKPYITVTTVGDTTIGKYVGSLTVKDVNNKGIVNPNHKWALQPIAIKLLNSKGVSDYVNGFAPDIAAEEDIANLVPFGDTNEPLLKAALDQISGVTQQSMVLKSKAIGLEKIADYKDFKQHSKEMYVNDKILKNITKKF
jgi:carboxyl-terminal processing protease